MKIGRVTISDRASAGLYQDQSGPEIERVLRAELGGPLEFQAVLVPDEVDLIRQALIRLAAPGGCALIVTTGGTGITPRDVTPEATRAVLEKELPGFGEVMRLRSFERTPTAPLSRALAGVRGRCLIINLPGKPKAIEECLIALASAIREALRHLAGDSSHDAHNGGTKPSP